MWKQSSKEHLSAEPLRASDAEIEEQKRAWELKRLATLTHDNDVIGFVKDVVPPPPPNAFPRRQQCVHGLHTLGQN
jgi:hypothetical protein